MTYALINALAAIVPTQACAQAVNHDSYAVMLNYLDADSIGGRVAAGTQGITSVNTAAGDANRQANLHAFALAGRPSALLHARQRTPGNGATNATLDARATIGGHAYADGQGIASINQASGNSNAQLNGVAVQLAKQDLPEATDAALSATVAVSTGGQTLPNPHAQAGTRRVAVEPSAMQGFNGVLQLNQVAGSGNASNNLLRLSAPASPH